MNTSHKLTSFVRCNNPLDVPESMCTVCLHTLIARDLEALEEAEIRHVCSMSDPGMLTGD